MTELPGHKSLVVNIVVVGPFEKEEEGTGIPSDVVKVKGEDPDTPGYLRPGGTGWGGMSAISDRGCVPLGSLVMKPRDRNDFPISVL